MAKDAGVSNEVLRADYVEKDKCWPDLGRPCQPTECLNLVNRLGAFPNDAPLQREHGVEMLSRACFGSPIPVPDGGPPSYGPACAELAKFFQDARYPRDDAFAVALYHRACNWGWHGMPDTGNACIVEAHAYRDGVGVANDAKRYVEILQDTCRSRQIPEACDEVKQIAQDALMTRAGRSRRP